MAPAIPPTKAGTRNHPPTETSHAQAASFEPTGEAVPTIVLYASPQPRYWLAAIITTIHTRAMGNPITISQNVKFRISLTAIP